MFARCSRTLISRRARLAERKKEKPSRSESSTVEGLDFERQLVT